MLFEDVGIVGMDERVLDRLGKEDFGVAHEKLVERIVQPNENGERIIRAATGAPRLLPQTRNRARIADEHGRVEVANVNPQLQCIRRRHAEQIALEQPGFDLAPFVGEIAGAVGTDAVNVLGRVRFQVLARIIEDEFRRLARAGLVFLFTHIAVLKL